MLYGTSATMSVHELSTTTKVQNILSSIVVSNHQGHRGDANAMHAGWAVRHHLPFFNNKCNLSACGGFLSTFL